MVNSTAAAIGLLADRLIGEPPAAVHPVALFGKAMRRVEKRIYRDSRARGVLHAAVGTGIGTAAGVALRSPSSATYLAVAGRALAETANQIRVALDAGDLDQARALLPGLVGRDPSGLDEKEIARAVVESVAENT